jgi:tetratricopeptide (TPR) repeat protein
LPLAIELAAARVRLFAPPALLARLDQRLQVLTGGARERTTRQQTLRGAIDWSYNLLTGGEQQLFRRLAVFQGGRTLQAMEAVCNAEGDLAVEVLEGVESLVEKNLLKQREGRDGEPRFWMLETLQEYAREKLVQSGEAAALEREHARYFMGLAEQAEPHLTGGGQQEKEWLGRLEEEHDNIRAALRWARADKGSAVERAEGVRVGLGLAGAMGRFWEVGGYWREGREQLAGLLALEAAAQAASRRYRAKALSAAGVLTYWLGDHTTARALTEEGLGLWRELGDKAGSAGPLILLGHCAYDQGDYAAARPLFEESLALTRELGGNEITAGSLDFLGNIASEQGDYAAARSLVTESLALRRAFGDKLRIADSLRSHGQLAYVQGDYDAAQAWFEESLVLARESGHKWGLVCSLSNLGLVAYERGDYAAARPLVEESLVLAGELGDKLGIAAALVYLGGLAVASAGSRVPPGRAAGQMGAGAGAEQEGVERGARLLGAGEVLLESIGVKLEPHDRRVHERANTAARAGLGEEAFERARQQGRAMSMEQAIGYALGEKP